MWIFFLIWACYVVYYEWSKEEEREEKLKKERELWNEKMRSKYLDSWIDPSDINAAFLDCVASTHFQNCYNSSRNSIHFVAIFTGIGTGEPTICRSAAPSHQFRLVCHGLLFSRNEPGVPVIIVKTQKEPDGFSIFLPQLTLLVYSFQLKVQGEKTSTEVCCRHQFPSYGISSHFNRQLKCSKSGKHSSSCWTNFDVAPPTYLLVEEK